MKKARTITGRWTTRDVLTALVIPTALAVIPGIRKRYGFATFSVPSLALMGGLWLWQHHLEKRSAQSI